MAHFATSRQGSFAEKWLNVAGLSQTHFYEKYLTQMKGQNTYVHWHALKDGHLWLFEMLGVSLLKFQHFLSKATCENCLHVVAENNTYYYVICLRTGVTFWHDNMLWVILASAGLFRCPAPAICWRGRSIRCPSPTPELIVTWVATIESNHWEDSTA